MLALDTVHSNCMQKTLCTEFADEIVENSLELDPVKRSWVYIPKVVQKRGRLRWIGDIIANAVNRVGRKIGLAATNNRRQSTAGLGILGTMTNFAAARVNDIPLPSIMQ